MQEMNEEFFNRLYESSSVRRFLERHKDVRYKLYDTMEKILNHDKEYELTK